ncbi:beta-ketoacyl-ACP synthase II [Chloroflexota bacterium]
MSERRVVVTGLGAVTPLGLNVADYWEGLAAGRSGIGPITLFDASDYPVKVAAEVKGFEPTDYMHIKRADRTGRGTQFAIAAARQAIEASRLDMSRERPERVGVVLASAGLISLAAEQGEIIARRGPMRVDPLFISKMSAHMVPVQVGLEFGAKGPNSCPNSACASGNDSIGVALNHLRLGHADVMIAGASESQVSPLAIAATGRVGALTPNPDPATACRPFDLNRDGFVFGEGTGILILETYEHAKARGAPILAELAGAGWSFDAYSETAPDAEMQAAAMRAALADAGVAPQEVDYINAHGTSTKLNDAAETKAIKTVFGEHAYRIPVSSFKSMIGHVACAAGSVEAVGIVKAIMEGVIPPTINYKIPDPECDLDYVPNKARQQPFNVCLSNGFGMGGQNCCLVFRKVPDAR